VTLPPSYPESQGVPVRLELLVMQMIIPIATRTQEGSQRLLNAIKARAFMCDEIAIPLKRCDFFPVHQIARPGDPDKAQVPQARAARISGYWRATQISLRTGRAFILNASNICHFHFIQFNTEVRECSQTQ
jgi:hypothetical protein